MSDGDGVAKEIGENAIFVPTDVSLTMKWLNIPFLLPFCFFVISCTHYQDEIVLNYTSLHLQ